MTKIYTSVLLVFSGVLLAGSVSQAVSIDWSGTYRFEAVTIDSTTLGDPKNSKSYLLQNLTLSPKIIAVDGVNIIGTFQFLGNPNYPGSQVGQVFGNGTNRGTAASMNGSSSNVVEKNQGSSQFSVRHLYMSINQEYGAIVVGRAPVEFGLGMTYNAGNGAFDHWGDSHDMLGYKVLVGNLSMMPMLGKPYDYSTALGRDVTDIMLDVQYNNPETQSTFGFFHTQRNAGPSANDANNVLGGTVTGNYSSKSTNLILGRGWDSFKFKLEAGFQEGNAGLTIASEEVKLNGYGIVFEMDFPRPESKWNWKLKGGVVSGDNPGTNNFEGYALHRNYDVAFLMFNHPMGGYDVFRTAFQRQRDTSCTTPPCGTYLSEESLDEEAVSNTIFINPVFSYAFSDKWSWRNSIVYAQSQTNPSTIAANNVSKDLGFEWDTSLVYKPHERIQWINEVGVFAPGAAWKEGSVDRKSDLNWGFQSKAAVTF